jgi:glycosyltransferase involved in cell wall biosynthesis
VNVLLDNVDLTSSSGPNSFAYQLVHQLVTCGIGVFDLRACIARRTKIDVLPDIHLAFIEANITGKMPLIQRLDGIYYNSDQQYGDWWTQNKLISETYERAAGVIFQSHFSRRLVETFFGSKHDTVVICNGVDIDTINTIDIDVTLNIPTSGDMWMSASTWRPHKRLSENVRYFLEHSSENDTMVVAGHVDRDLMVIHNRVLYIGECSRDRLLSLYKRAKYFVHLAYHDNCPNVVVDARAAGCHIICASCSGTPEIAGLGATVIVDDDWDPAPIRLYEPPMLDFTRNRINCIDSSINIVDVTRRYVDFMRRFM